MTFAGGHQRRAVLSALFAVLMCLVVSLTTAGTATAGDEQKETDVQLLLANDEDVARLKQDLGTKQVSSADYAARLAELAKGRSAILARYDRAGQRALVALYNSAVKTRNAAALEAKRKADAEAKAKATEEKLAAAEAAKRAAADLVAAQAKAVEDDAQEFTRLAMLHDELLLKFNMKRASEAEREELARLRVGWEAIQKRYAPGGPSRSRSANYEKRVKELSLELVQPASRRWLTDAFPEPDAVVAAYSGDEQRVAALRILARLLDQKSGTPPIAATTEKLERYRTAMVALKPSERGDYGGLLLDGSDGLEDSREFQLEVIERFVPLYANEISYAGSKEKYQAGVKTDFARFYLGIACVALLVLLVPIVHLARGQRSLKSRLHREFDDTDPFRLPRELAVVEVFRKRYLIEFDGGLVTGKRHWTETITTISSSYETYTVNGISHQRMTSWGRSTQTIHHYHYTLEAPDGRSPSWHFVGSPSDPEPGQLFSTVDQGGRLLFHLNHSTGNLLGHSDGISEANRMYGLRLWWISVAVAVAGMLAVDHFLDTDVLREEKPLLSSTVLPWMLLIAFVSAIYVGLLTRIVEAIRAKQFEANWRPRIEKFMQERTPLFEARFPPAERARFSGDPPQRDRRVLP